MALGERIGGLLRGNLVESLDAVIGSGYSGLEYVDQFSAPIMAWFKPLRPLPLGRLFAVDPSSTEQLLFSKEQEDALITHFFLVVHPVCYVVQQSDLDSFDSLTPLLRTAIFYTSACSLPLFESQKLFGTTKESLVKKLRAATEDLLSQADIFGRFDLRIFQAVIIYLTPHLISEVSRSHATFVAAIIRHAQSSGIDKLSPTDTSFELHTKYHLWQHLLFLNSRVTEVVGPERTIFDDSNTYTHPHPTTPNETFAITRYKCYHLHRLVFKARAQIQNGTLTLPTFLDSLTQSIHTIRTSFNHLDPSIPINKCTILVGALLLARAQCMILQTQRHTWLDGLTNQSLRQIAISASLTVAETGIILSEDPALARWAWYAGTYQQYHSLLFLLVELYQTPLIPEAARILAVVEYVFGPSSSDVPEAKVARVLRAIRDSLASFLMALGSGRQKSDEPLEAMPEATLEASLEGMPEGTHEEIHEGMPQTMSEDMQEELALLDESVLAGFGLDPTGEVWWEFDYDLGGSGAG